MLEGADCAGGLVLVFWFVGGDGDGRVGAYFLRGWRRFRSQGRRCPFSWYRGLCCLEGGGFSGGWSSGGDRYYVLLCLVVVMGGVC